MTIQIEVKNVYGELKVYPACEKAALFAKIAGTKTLTHHTLCQIEALGYEIINATESPCWKHAA
ncbi:MAG TPA: hypothetical protein VFA29_07855 [Candidatus Baltobacteraceae bacterium]|nr:hypothetical protein [Candidatus Baltobacteraceae bacterium]